MKQKISKMLMVTLAFFTGYMCYAQTTPLQNPNTNIIGPDPVPRYYFPNGLDLGPYGYTFDKYWSYANNNNNKTDMTISAFLKTIKLNNPDNNAEIEKEVGNSFINKYNAEAQQGNEDKMLYMALTYRVYLHDEKNEIIWLDKLVAKNNDYAMMRRGDLFEDAKDINSSIALYQKVVASGNVTAMVGLAEKYILHVRDEINKPVELLTAAAAKNNTEACTELANLYTGVYGNQYPLDYSKTMDLYLQYLQLTDDKPATSDMIAQRTAVMKSIAMLYKNGNGVTKDNAACRQWMKKAKAEAKKASIYFTGV